MNTTVQAAARFGTAALRARTESRTDALRLLERALNRRREWIVAHGDEPLRRDDVRRFVQLLRVARSGVPLAYVLGKAGFYRRTFVSDERALVPRPETEVLVERALDIVRGVATPRILDVGTGSGAIACTIAAERPDALVTATDSSSGALSLARENARGLGLEGRCRFVCGDLVPEAAIGRYDAVIANLPYVPSSEIPSLPQPLAFEPRIALDGGPDGLAVYRRFVPSAPSLLAPGGVLLVEAAPAQMSVLAALVRAAFDTQAVVVGRDLAGLERYVEARAAGR